MENPTHLRADRVDFARCRRREVGTRDSGADRYSLDHQHSIMQQYGFARIYDFKAKTGGPLAARFDLWLGWTLYLNLLITSPLFTRFWVAELVRWQMSPSVETVKSIQLASWAITGIFVVVYIGQMVRGHRHGYSINSVKLVFIGASYFLWYFTSWHTDSILVFGIAHRITHGLQYIVMVYWYIRRKTKPCGDDQQTQVSKLVSSGNIIRFLLACLLYAVAFQLCQVSRWNGLDSVWLISPDDSVWIRLIMSTRNLCSASWH
ncbi:MAG TPA: hypothetical protein EYG03_09640 [Planctomycetes bacterium]|nr:hypothetical protein [Fuerstiella sp.]HIK92226.1 hypothetical protein [Planctomycetota bacterium]